jgi:uncharacterized protein YbbC (DUF1343 family)
MLLFIFPFSVSFGGEVKPGVEVLLGNNTYHKALKGKRLGLITNPTGVDSNLEPTADILWENANFKLVALFAPEHGIRGESLAGEHIRKFVDERTGLPVYSLHGNTKKPTEDMLKNIDVLIFDIQDIGARTYTYISTLFLAMEAADEQGKEFVVLDRPNPLGGVNIEGPVLHERYKSFLDLLEIPMIHGMTIGELAQFIKGEYKMELKLTVVPMKGWKRKMVWDDTGLTWVPTSTHIPTVESAFLYKATGTIGSENLCHGVGYTLPFQLIGSEWIEPYKLAETLNSKNLPGIKFQPYWFKPFYFGFKDRQISGVRLVITDKDEFKPVKTALEILTSLESLYPGKYKPPREFNNIWGVDYILGEVREGKTAEEISKKWQSELEKFKGKREKYLIYK